MSKRSDAEVTGWDDLVGVRVASIEWGKERLVVVFENGACIMVRARLDYDVTPPRRVSPEAGN